MRSSNLRPTRHAMALQPWYGALSVSQPVFQAGALRSGLRLTRAQWQESVLTYQQTVQTALEQVSDALVGYQKYRDFRTQQEQLTLAAQRSDQLSICLYQNGGASYLQVLTNDTNYFSAQLNLVNAQLNERLALVQLYEALGGRVAAMVGGVGNDLGGWRRRRRIVRVQTKPEIEQVEEERRK